MKYVRIEGNVAFVELTQGYEAKIDIDDVLIISKHSWCAVVVDGKRIYAWSSSAGYMHRSIMSPPEGMDVDHEDHNGLNNQRSNLRVGTRGQNMENRRGANKNSATGIRGVHIHRLKKIRKHATSKTEVVTYNARYMIMGKSYTKNFPFTPDGLEAAKQWVSSKRIENMTFSRD